MTRIALLADLHFGSVPEGLADLLREDILSAEPDAVVIAGDLTLRARRGEFADARDWLDRLPYPRLVIPGNHDIPKFNLWARFRSPFHRFNETVQDEERGPLQLDICTIFGLNTTSPWQPHLRWQEGRVRRRDLKRFAREVAETPPDRFRLVAAHHPFSKVPEMKRARPVRRAISTLSAFRAYHIDLVLSGHTHQSFVLPMNHGGRPLLMIGAPTALSDRRRGEENGYWLIDLAHDRIKLMRRLRNGGRFESGKPIVYGAENHAVKLQPEASAA